jgi:hypothetical protein
LYFGAVGVAAGLLLAKVASITIRQFYMKHLIGLEWTAYGRLLGMQGLLVLPLALALVAINVYVLPMGIWPYSSMIALCLIPYGGLFLWRFVKR